MAQIDDISPEIVRAKAILYEIGKMLEEKNRAYGNSAADPVQIFSKSDSIEQIRVRIDDKLSRIARGRALVGEDTVKNLIGYLAIYLAVQDSEETDEIVQREPLCAK
jgi:hypothetical protein